MGWCFVGDSQNLVCWLSTRNKKRREKELNGYTHTPNSGSRWNHAYSVIWWLLFGVNSKNKNFVDEIHIHSLPPINNYYFIHKHIHTHCRRIDSTHIKILCWLMHFSATAFLLLFIMFISNACSSVITLWIFFTIMATIRSQIVYHSFHSIWNFSLATWYIL